MKDNPFRMGCSSEVKGRHFPAAVTEKAVSNLWCGCARPGLPATTKQHCEDQVRHPAEMPSLEDLRWVERKEDPSLPLLVWKEAPSFSLPKLPSWFPGRRRAGGCSLSPPVSSQALLQKAGMLIPEVKFSDDNTGIKQGGMCNYPESVQWEEAVMEKMLGFFFS